ncbi:MAG: AAA family ATPase [Deltaproteobacteria bacterium]|nr:MAG: AAA family ATPase [Deltaproteobacteria bacterium]
MLGLKKKSGQIKEKLFDPDVQIEHRKQLLQHLVMDGSKESDAILKSFLEEVAAGNNGESLYNEKQKELTETLRALEEGPMRVGTFIGMEQPGAGPHRARVRLEDGHTVFTAVTEENLILELKRGDEVLLDGQAKAIFAKISLDDDTGEEAQFERLLFGNCIEVSVRGDQRHVFDASQDILDALDRGEVTPNSRLLTCFQRRFAKRVLPAEDGLGSYRFLDRRPLPDVLVERDIGDPPSYMERVVRMVELEMTKPELRRRYKLRRSMMLLLEGISGSGKSFSLLGSIRKIYDVMAEVTGVPVQGLPPRVLRLRPPMVLSKWFGETDRNIDRFFSEAEQLAGEKFLTPEGKEHDLPVIAVMEEIDGLTRTRGQDGIYDRILTTLLERTDPTRQELRDKLILFFGTTNVAHLIDMAFLRRIGGTVEHFGRLSRRSFAEVLDRHLDGLPLGSVNKQKEDDVRRSAVNDLTAWLYSPHGEDRGQVSLHFVGSAVPEIRYRRDFVTAGLVDRAVQQASNLACDAEDFGCDTPGVTPEILRRCFHQQVQAIVRQLRVQNVANYLELPEGVRVQRVEPIEQPAVLPSELLRVACG